MAQDGVTHVIEVGDLHPVEQDHVLELHGIAHDDVFPDDGAAADEGAVPHLGAVVDDTGSFDPGAGVHPGVFGDPDVFRRMVELLRGEGGTQGEDEPRDMLQDLPGVFPALEQGRG
jgi:hypothetical protein